MGATALRYYNIDKLYSDCDETSFLWRLIALFSSWALLLSFLTIPPLLDKDPQLDFGRYEVLLPVAIVLVTLGLLTSALVSIARRNWLFQAESVFLPAFSSCAIGFIYLTSVISSSARYEWDFKAILLVVAAAVMAMIYGSLNIYTRRKINNISDYSHQRPVRFWGDAGSRRNYAANMFSRNKSSQAGQSKDEDLTRHQMLQLLQKRESATSPDAASSTFRINLPDNDDESLTLSPRGRSRTNTLLPMSPMNNQMWDATRRNSREALEAFQPSHQRTLSREQRRREIEMGL